MEGQIQDLIETVHRSHAGRDQRAAEPQSLVETGRLLASSPDLRDFFDRLAEITSSRLGVDVVHIWLRGEANEALALSSQAGTLCTDLWPIPGKELAGWMMDQGRLLALPDARTDPSLKNRAWFEAEGFSAVLGAPLFVDGTPVGILACLSRARREWSSEEVAVAEALAISAGVAIRNARLLAQEQQLREEAEVLLEIARATGSIVDEKELFTLIAQGAVRACRVDRCSIFLWEELGEWVVPVTSQFADGTAHLQPGKTFDTLGKLKVEAVPFFQEAVRRREPVLISEPATDPLIPLGWGERFQLKSVLVVPLIHRDRVIGGLVLDCVQEPRPLTPEQVRRALTLAGQVALAMENIRLVRSLQHTLDDLKLKNAELENFVHSVSHDLKAPLVTIQGMSSILLEEHGAKLDAEGRHYLHRINANIQQMDRLIGDLLTLSRIGREGRAPEAVPLAELVDDLLVELAEPMRARGIKVIGRNLGTIWAIRSQMEQVIGNLLSNAVKYLGDTPSPTVEIGTLDREEFVECYVKDNGIGIDPAYHERVFETFQRLNEVKAEGTGVGLAIVKKIVETAGGRVWVESAKGQGATFHFTWPKAPRKNGRGSVQRGAALLGAEQLAPGPVTQRGEWKG